MRDLTEIMRHITMVGQLGLSLAMPLLLCIFVCYELCTRLGVGVWVYIPGIFFGLGSSFMTAYKVYLSVNRKNGKRERSENEISMNKHI